MKKFLGFLAALFISSAAFAQSGAKIEFTAKDKTIDYGTVVQGQDNGIRSFEFTNTGDAPLVITSVRSTCGCTIPSKPEKPIMPGEKGKIDVKYNMSKGKISKSISIETNAVNLPEGMTSLRIKGEVVEKK